MKIFSARTAAYAIALIVGLGVFAAACFSDYLLLTFNYHPALAIVDDMIVGAFAAGLVLYYEWRRDAELRRKLSTITEMNHHVRNQLEVIEYSAWTTHDQAHIAQMHEAVSRIQWALREILGSSCAPPPLSHPRPELTSHSHGETSAPMSRN